MPQIGAPLTYVTTATFLSVFGLGSLRELPDIEALEDAGLLERGEPVDWRPDSLDGVLGLVTGEDRAGQPVRAGGRRPEDRAAL